MCETSTAFCSSPIGRLAISYCSQGLHSVWQTSAVTDNPSFVPDLKKSIELEQPGEKKDLVVESCLTWLVGYFHLRKRAPKKPKLCPNITSKNNSFQENVWRTLLNEVPFGQTISYGQLAELAGNKRAARAVGSAMRRNPFQLIVPCHRVIRSSGHMGNYAGGERNSVKLWLLKHEQN